MPSPAFPEPPSALPDTPLSKCDALVTAAHAAAPRWIAQDIPARVALLRRCMQSLWEAAEEWVAVSCRAKGHQPGSAGEGEEWLAGPLTTMRNLRLLIDALEAGGAPKLPGRSQRADGQWVARVFPTDLPDRLLFTGFTADVWIQPGEEPSQGRVYREPKGSGGVSVVLGAGNVSSIGPMDALYKLFVDDEVVILKMNPVNAYLGPVFERAMAPLVQPGFIAVVYGGAEVGGHLCHHPQVASIHITGSDRTHDAIVWGSDPDERQRRQDTDDPILKKEITSELGCVTPLLIVPGPWSDADIDYHARHVVGMVANNGSFNCNAAKVLVLPGGWDKRDAFVTRVEHHLSRLPARKAYYPGAQQRYESFVAEYPDARPLGPAPEGAIPWTVIPSVKPQPGEYALSNEAFCGVLALCDVDAADAPSYLAAAVPLCNDVIWGTLSCMMLVHPKTQKAHGARVEKAIADLRYGGIAVNAWAGLVYGLVVTSWGAFPGHTLKDIRSGRGAVHNTFLLDHPQKSVVRAPFRIQPTPAWFSDHRNLPALGRRLTAFEMKPSVLGVPKVAMAALKG